MLLTAFGALLLGDDNALLEGRGRGRRRAALKVVLQNAQVGSGPRLR